MDTQIISEIQSSANSVLEKVIAAQTGLAPGVTDPILTKVEGLLEGVIGHLFNHPNVAKTGPTGVVSSGSPLVPIASAAVKASAILLLIGSMFLFTACKSPKLAAGGAYYPTTNNAPQVALYTADATFDLAESSLDAAFLIERKNRAFLWSISPKIKHDLDAIRPTAADVIRRYLVARAVYVASPTPANATTLQALLSQVQALSSAAVAATASITNTVPAN